MVYHQPVHIHSAFCSPTSLFHCVTFTTDCTYFQGTDPTGDHSRGQIFRRLTKEYVPVAEVLSDWLGDSVDDSLSRFLGLQIAVFLENDDKNRAFQSINGVAQKWLVYFMENPKPKWMIPGGIPISANHQFFGIRQDESQEGDLGLLRFGVADMIPTVPTEF